MLSLQTFCACGFGIFVLPPLYLHLLIIPVLPLSVPLMARRLLKVSSLATAVFASSGFYLYNKQLDFNDLSLIRFGRAAATVSYQTSHLVSRWVI